MCSDPVPDPVGGNFIWEVISGEVSGDLSFCGLIS